MHSLKLSQSDEMLKAAFPFEYQQIQKLQIKQHYLYLYLDESGYGQIQQQWQLYLQSNST